MSISYVTMLNRYQEVVFDAIYKLPKEIRQKYRKDIQQLIPSFLFLQTGELLLSNSDRKILYAHKSSVILIIVMENTDQSVLFGAQFIEIIYQYVINFSEKLRKLGRNTANIKSESSMMLMQVCEFFQEYLPEELYGDLGNSVSQFLDEWNEFPERWLKAPKLYEMLQYFDQQELTLDLDKYCKLTNVDIVQHFIIRQKGKKNKSPNREATKKPAKQAEKSFQANHSPNTQTNHESKKDSNHLQKSFKTKFKNEEYNKTQKLTLDNQNADFPKTLTDSQQNNKQPVKKIKFIVDQNQLNVYPNDQFQEISSPVITVYNNSQTPAKKKLLFADLYDIEVAPEAVNQLK